MKYIVLGGWIALAAAKTAMAETTLPAGAPARHDILIRTNSGHGIPGSILLPAIGVATRILAQAGLKIRWDKAANLGPPIPLSGCRSRHLNVVDVALLLKAPAATPPSALASAFPFASGGTRIYVYWGQLLEMHPSAGPELQRSLLGHVLAHEIAHIMLGSKEHSTSGLMKAEWTSAEEGAMQVRPLTILPSDIQAMQRNLEEDGMACSVLAASGSAYR